VFGVGGDPVKLGLVASLNRPGGNATGFNLFTNELATKRMQLLRELVRAAKRVALLTNPTDPANESLLRDVETAAPWRSSTPTTRCRCDPNLKTRLVDLGGTLLAGSPADFGKLIDLHRPSLEP
jgi:hypothetical protein